MSKTLADGVAENRAVWTTPWGHADHRTKLAEGIWSVSTPGHGGIYVRADLLHKIPDHHRAWAKRWSGSEQWYEEDCCWACVALAFPDLFKAEDLEAARRTLTGCKIAY